MASEKVTELPSEKCAGIWEVLGWLSVVAGVIAGIVMAVKLKNFWMFPLYAAVGCGSLLTCYTVSYFLGAAADIRRIRSALSARAGLTVAPAVQTAPTQKPAPEQQPQPQTAAVPLIAKAVPDSEHPGMIQCSNCGERQPCSRTVCFNCGAKLTKE